MDQGCKIIYDANVRFFNCTQTSIFPGLSSPQNEGETSSQLSTTNHIWKAAVREKNSPAYSTD